MKTMEDRDVKAESTMISHRRLNHDTLEYYGWCGRNPTDKPVYCREKPSEVIRVLAPDYHIGRYKDVRRPFGSIDWDAGGLEIDSAEVPVGCSITGSLEELNDFLSLPYNLQTLSWESSHQRNTSAKRGKSVDQGFLRKTFNARVQSEHSPEAFRKRKYPDEQYDAVDKWMKFDQRLWDVIKSKPCNSGMPETNRDLYSRLERFFWELADENYPVNKMGISGLMQVYEFLEEESFRKIIYNAIKENGLDGEVGKDLVDSFIDDSIREVDKTFTRGYLEIFGMVNGVDNPSFFDVRNAALGDVDMEKFRRELAAKVAN